MNKKIFSIAAALAALAATPATDEAKAAAHPAEVPTTSDAKGTRGVEQPNVLIPVGEDLLGMNHVRRASNQTVLTT